MTQGRINLIVHALINIGDLAIRLGQGLVFFNLVAHLFQHGDGAGGVDFGKLLVDLLGRGRGARPGLEGNEVVLIFGDGGFQLLDLALQLVGHIILIFPVFQRLGRLLAGLFFLLQGLGRQALGFGLVHLAILHLLQQQHGFALIFGGLRFTALPVLFQANSHALDLGQTGHAGLEIVLEITDTLLGHTNRVFHIIKNGMSFGLSDFE